MDTAGAPAELFRNAAGKTLRLAVTFMIFLPASTSRSPTTTRRKMKTTILGSLVLTSTLLLTALAAAESTDYTYTITGNAVTVTGYRGPGGPANIPDAIDGLPVTRIADRAFFGCTTITSVSMPGTVTHVGDYAFYSCIRLASVDLPESLTHIGEGAFSRCTSLTDLKTGDGLANIGDWAFYGCSKLVTTGIGDGVTNIGFYAFYSCSDLYKITAGRGLNHIGWYAFRECPGLNSMYFEGNAPATDTGVFYDTTNATVYFRPGTKGWGKSFAGLPTVLWNPQIRSDGPLFGVRSNQFGFAITGTPDIPIVVEACIRLGRTPWEALQVCTLTNGFLYFSDPTWTNHHSRFYRIASP